MFPGDKKNSFTKEGRTAEDQDLIDYVRKAAHLHTQLDPLKRGELINLQVADQQYAYARKTKNAVVVALINNDTKAANFEFEVGRAGLVDNTSLIDRLGSLGDVRISSGSLKASLPARSAAVLAPR